jgi:hypothetical protein
MFSWIGAHEIELKKRQIGVALLYLGKTWPTFEATSHQIRAKRDSRVGLREFKQRGMSWEQGTVLLD